MDRASPNARLDCPFPPPTRAVQGLIVIYSRRRKSRTLPRVFLCYTRCIKWEEPLERHTEERIVKIPLPVALIRQIDEAIVSGLGGYSTRTEFFRDAAEGLLLELKYEP